MSLFGGLFGHAGASSGLFSTQSAFKAHHDKRQSAEEQQKESENRKEKRRKQQTGSARAFEGADAATDAAARKLQTSIAVAEAVQSAAEAAQDTTIKQKRRIGEKQERQSKKAPKRSADSTPAAASAELAGKQRLHQQSERSILHPGQLQTHVEETRPRKNKRTLLKASEQATRVAAQLDQPQQVVADAAAAAVDTNGLDNNKHVEEQYQSSDKAAATPEEEAEKLSRTIFVGNLPVALKHKQLTRLFSSYGEVESVRMRSVPVDLESKTKLPRKAAVIKGVISSDRGGKNAYVVFKQESAVEEALAANMTEVDGHHIRVDRAAKPSTAGALGATTAGGSGAGVLYDPVRSVFVGNLDFKVTEEQLIQTFSDGSAQPELMAAVEAVRVVRDPRTNIGKGIAYVLFKTKAAARAALQLDGQQLGKRGMRVSRVDRNLSSKTSAAGQKSTAAGGTKRFQDKSKAGSLKPNRGQHDNNGLPSVKQGGVEKRSGRGAAAADWQGLRTKGKGSGFRGSSRVAKPSGSSAGAKKRDSSKSHGKVKGGGSSRQGGKRPAVAARKEKAKAAAKKAKTK